MSYALVIGEKGRHKSTAMREVAQGLTARGLRVAGFTQRTFEVAPGRKTVEVVRVCDGSAVQIARTSADPGDAAAVCSFAFESPAFEEARRWLEADAAAADVIVLDGMGKLELGGGGHRGTIEYALRAGLPVVLGVREDSLVYALEALALGEPLASYGTTEDAAALDRFLDAIARVTASARGRGAPMRDRPGKETTSTSTS
jgi:nucleoside-triphosphatase THEP1